MSDFSGTTANDTLIGTAGADSFVGNLGNDSIEGGGGSDRAVFSGNSADYRFDMSRGSLLVTDLKASDGNDGADLLRNVWTLQFADRTIVIEPGGEVRANTTLAQPQTDAAVAVLANGSYV